MNRSRQRVEELRKISEIRAISTRLAEAKCVEASRNFVVMNGKQKQEQQNLNEVVNGWEAAMAAPYFNPGNTIFWGHEINLAVSEVDKAICDTNKCAAILERTEKDMAFMIANAQCADTLLFKAKKKHVNKAENQFLAELADQFTRLEMRKR